MVQRSAKIQEPERAAGKHRRPSPPRPDLEAVRARATAVFEDADEAERWLNEPNPALGGEAPLALARSREGRRTVETVLSRIEHGDYT